jgi:hypothetical protein
VAVYILPTDHLATGGKLELPAKAIELENRHIGPHGEPTLAQACELLLQSWDEGDRGRELALHLMFLCWYLLIEPGCITGLESTDPICDRLQRAFNEVHNHFSVLLSRDAEMLYVVGLMAHLSPWLLGDNDEWEVRSANYRLLYRKLAPSGIDPQIFAGRGYYGHYFYGQAGIRNGY